jgi:hypothetical protein
LLSLVQKSHYQSAYVPKILAALAIYRGLAEIQIVRPLVVSKVRSMLLHNYTKVRIAAAETLFVISNSHIIKKELKVHDWSQPRAELKSIVEEI